MGTIKKIIHYLLGERDSRWSENHDKVQKLVEQGYKRTYKEEAK